ncbi:hypothetical protein M758_4G123000 [Ceratodon purpureus]|nr:hypothetical protein M758_4G123000 [Ceratodon purpureus]
MLFNWSPSILFVVNFVVWNIMSRLITKPCFDCRSFLSSSTNFCEFSCTLAKFELQAEDLGTEFFAPAQMVVCLEARWDTPCFLRCSKLCPWGPG